MALPAHFRQWKERRDFFEAKNSGKIWLAKNNKIKGVTPEIKQLNLYLEKVKLKIR